jgi:hypothetical protein
MTSDWRSLITPENEPKLWAVVRRKLTLLSSFSLLIWGSVNCVTWYYLGEDTRKLLLEIHNPSDGVFYLLYGTLAFASFQLAGAVFGFVTRLSGAMLWDAAALLMVGGSNLLDLFITPDILRPYGLEVKGTPNQFFLMMGVCQIVWAFRQCGVFMRISEVPVVRIDDATRKQFAEAINAFLSTKPENAGDDVLFATVPERGLVFWTEATHVPYRGVLLGDRALFISSKSNNCISIPRAAIAEFPVTAGSITYKGAKVFIADPFMKRFKEWVDSKPPTQTVAISHNDNLSRTGAQSFRGSRPAPEPSAQATHACKVRSEPPKILCASRNWTTM